MKFTPALIFLAAAGAGAAAVPDLGSGSSSNDTLRFIAFGDWGGLPTWPYRTPREIALADRMGVLAEKFNPDSFLVLGDNFYFDGVTSVDDKRWKETYEDVFTHAGLQKPWHVVLGNHDHLIMAKIPTTGGTCPRSTTPLSARSRPPTRPCSL
jgi:hypothetical protein